MKDFRIWIISITLGLTVLILSITSYLHSYRINKMLKTMEQEKLIIFYLATLHGYPGEERK